MGNDIVRSQIDAHINHVETAITLGAIPRTKLVRIIIREGSLSNPAYQIPTSAYFLSNKLKYLFEICITSK